MDITYRRATRAANATPDWVFPQKAGVDAALALTLLVLAGPAVLLIMLLVRLTSRGPALYRQARVGRDGRTFTIYKIRTMAHNCELASGPRWSTPGDPRVTRLGRWLRRTHVDELPQLWNVLRGDMSLVGPRPERPEFVVRLEHAVPGYRNRLAVRPGVTGLAQVQLPPDEDLAGVARKVACDLAYVTAMGPWLDLRIMVATAFKVIGVPTEWTRQFLRLPGLEPATPASAGASELGESGGDAREGLSYTCLQTS